MRTWMIHWRLLPFALLLLVLLGCGGTWINDDGNFKRIFAFRKPPEVDVVHSYYWKSPHWTVEYSYFIVLKASPKFAAGLTSGEHLSTVVPDEKLLDSCGQPRPQWFLPKPWTGYEAWVPKAAVAYRIFRDKADGTLFLCDQRL